MGLDIYISFSDNDEDRQDLGNVLRYNMSRSNPVIYEYIDETKTKIGSAFLIPKIEKILDAMKGNTNSFYGNSKYHLTGALLFFSYLLQIVTNEKEEIYVEYSK